MRCAIREHQTVQTELTVIRCIAKIAAIRPESVAIFVFFGQRLIHPVPDESALQARVIAKGLPVFCKSTKAVAHGMRVLTQDQRARLIRHADPLFQRPFRYGFKRLILIDTGIHRADDISRSGVCAAAFILHRARGIGTFNPAIQRIVVSAVPGFIAQ
ncbi:hypothetical protein D3C80_870670 [compost metagenome]